MAVELIMPKLGMYTEDILLLSWAAEEGAPVRRGEVVFVLETDKTTAEVEAEGDGLLHRLVEAGETVPIGGRVGLIAGSAEEYSSLLGAPDASAAPPGTLAPADESDGHPFLGYIAGGGPAAVAAAGPAVPSATGAATPAPPPAADAPARPRPARVLASPRALALLARSGHPPLSAAAIAGSGPGGRVLERDVVAYLGTPPAPSEAVAPGDGVLERRALRGRRGVIARRMVASLHGSAQLTSVLEIDASGLLAERARLSGASAERISYTAILLAVLGRALRRHPLFNARIVGEEVELLADVDVGVAVDSEDGLIVPVLRRVDSLTTLELNGALRELVARARAGRLAPADVEGGGFTLSNAGIYPVDITTAILNPPQAALLWVGRIRERPFVIDGGLFVRPTLQACLTFDHRAIDGGPAAAFLGTFDELIGELAGPER